MTGNDSQWAGTTFGLHVDHVGGDQHIADLVLPGLRRNPRRAHLLVSTVLGKHIAAAPDTVIQAARRLGAAVTPFTDGDIDVLGMAETATSLGHCVSDHLEAGVYLHTTRRKATRQILADFQEGHSHATHHTIQPTSARLLGHDRPLVIVDDEISTGTTALAAIEALHRITPRPLYVVASLVDVRQPHHREAVTRTAEHLGARIEFVSLARGRVRHPPELIESVCSLAPPALNILGDQRGGDPRCITLPWPADVPEGGRHGFLRSDRPAFTDAVNRAASAVADHLDVRRPTLVVGHEELMYLPLRLAECLERRGANVRFQSTTRSPAYVHDDHSYPLRRGYQFCASDDAELAPRYLYNGWRAPGSRSGATQLILVVDVVAAAAWDSPDGAAAVLAAAGYDVTVAVVAGPDIDTLAEHRCRVT